MFAQNVHTNQVLVQNIYSFPYSNRVKGMFIYQKVQTDGNGSWGDDSKVYIILKGLLFAGLGSESARAVVGTTVASSVAATSPWVVTTSHAPIVHVTTAAVAVLLTIRRLLIHVKV